MNVCTLKTKSLMVYSFHKFLYIMKKTTTTVNCCNRKKILFYSFNFDRKMWSTLSQIMQVKTKMRFKDNWSNYLSGNMISAYNWRGIPAASKTERDCNICITTLLQRQHHHQNVCSCVKPKSLNSFLKLTSQLKPTLSLLTSVEENYDTFDRE